VAYRTELSGSGLHFEKGFVFARQTVKVGEYGTQKAHKKLRSAFIQWKSSLVGTETTERYKESKHGLWRITLTASSFCGKRNSNEQDSVDCFTRC